MSPFIVVAVLLLVGLFVLLGTFTIWFDRTEANSYDAPASVKTKPVS